jgi:hypothetical protein
MPPKKKKDDPPPVWRNSMAKKLLEEDLKSGRIPIDHDPEDVYLQRTEFFDFEYEHFRARLRDLRDVMINHLDRAASDSAALAHDRQAACYPKPTHDHRGKLRWEGGEAERLLRIDMENGKHKRMKPELLHITRGEYQHYTLPVFRCHIDQEVRRQKFRNYHRSKKNKQLLEIGLPPLPPDGALERRRL